MTKTMLKLRSTWLAVAASTFATLGMPSAFADISGYIDSEGKYHASGGGGGAARRFEAQRVAMENMVNAVYFFLTILIELPIYYYFGLRSKKAMACALLVNIVSLSIFYTLNGSYDGGLSDGIGLLVAEILVTVFEAVALWLLLKKELSAKVIVTATIAANVTSCIVGLMLSAYVTPRILEMLY